MMKIANLLKKYKEMILYVLFGGATTLVNIITYFVCSNFGISTALSTIIAWVVSVLFAFVTNKFFVFESKEYAIMCILKELLKFSSCRIATGLLDLAVMVICVDFFVFNEFLIKILSNVLVVILNYVASKLFIFTEGKLKC